MYMTVGSKDNNNVKRVQRVVGVTPDGDFGPKTRAAVKEFQRKHRLSQDGIVGNHTWKAIVQVESQMRKAALQKRVMQTPPKPVPKPVAVVKNVQAAVAGRPLPGYAMTEAQKLATYGTNADEVKKNLVSVTWPRKNLTLLVHKIHAEQFLNAFKKVDAYEIPLGLDYKVVSYGTFCWRNIRGGTSLSNHSFGIAVDFNTPTNPMSYTLITDMPDYFVLAFTSEGFRWGGNYHFRKDAMHYEA